MRAEMKSGAELFDSVDRELKKKMKRANVKRES